jgi:uncharacterized protein (TIGR02231 family)
MKNVTLLLILWLPMTVFGQLEKPVTSSISGVTVFLSKAQINRAISTRLDAGKTHLIVTGLTSQLDQSSIQVSGKGSFIILGISHRQNFLSEFNVPKPLKALNDSLEFLQKELERESAEKEILNKEEQLLLSNQHIGGTNQNLTAAELKAMADFFRGRFREILTARMKQDLKIKNLNERIAKMQNQIAEQNELYSRNTSEIVISVSAEAPTTATFEVSYIVANAGWYPVYDLRATNTKSPVIVNYKANVFQNTGEQWENVRLKLSTANPNLSGLKPELATWFLDFYNYAYYSYSNSNKKERLRSAGAVHRGMEEDQMAAESVAAGPAETAADYVSTIQTTLNTEFDISLPYTVKSASKPTLVDIRNHELTANYIYSVAPKLDKDAFLIARATGWEDLNLLPGNANIFFEGTYVGETTIDPNVIRDTLNVSLGRDKRIVVKREKLKDFSSKKLIGTNQRDSYAFEISVRNTKTETIKIIVEDQMPISQNSQIEITVLDTGNSKYNKDNGKMVWELTLAPNETKKVSFKYEVKYPKGKTVTGLE